MNCGPSDQGSVSGSSSDISKAVSAGSEGRANAYHRCLKYVDKFANDMRDELWDIKIWDSDLANCFRGVNEDRKIVLVSNILSFFGYFELIIELIWMKANDKGLAIAAKMIPFILFANNVAEISNHSEARNFILKILTTENIGCNRRLFQIRNWSSMAVYFAEFLVGIWPEVSSGEMTSAAQCLSQLANLCDGVWQLKGQWRVEVTPKDLINQDEGRVKRAYFGEFSPKVPSSIGNSDDKKSNGSFAASFKSLSLGNSKLLSSIPHAAWFDDNCEPIPIEVIEATKSIDSLQAGASYTVSEVNCYGIAKSDTKNQDKAVKAVKTILEGNGWYKKFDPIKNPGSAISWLNMLVQVIADFEDDSPRALLAIVYSACDTFHAKLKILLTIPVIHKQSVKVKRQWIISALMVEFNQFKYTKFAEKAYQDVRQNTGEKLSEFAERVIQAKGACKSDIFNATDIREMINIFVKGIIDTVPSELANKMDLSIYSSLPSFVDELNRRLEYVRQVEMPNILSTPSATVSHQLRYAEGSRKRLRNEDDKPRTHVEKSEVKIYTCFRCGKNGHIAKFCRDDKPADCHTCCQRCGSRGHKLDICRVVSIRCQRCTGDHRESVCPCSWDEVTKKMGPASGTQKQESVRGAVTSSA